MAIGFGGPLRMMPSAKLMSWMFLVAIFYLVAVICYRLFLHPLRVWPGPPVAKVTSLWKLNCNLKGRKAHEIHEAHQKYGPVVRVAPNELSFSSPEASKTIYNSDAFAKEQRFYFAKRIFHENHMLSYRNNDAHKQRKRLLQRGFSQSAMLEFEPQMSEKISTLLQQLSRAPQPVDLFQWAHWLGFDVVYHLMFDEDPGSIKAGQPHWVMGHMKAWRPTFIYKEFFPQLENWGPYVPGYVGTYFRRVSKWKKFAVGVIKSCRARGTETPFLANALNGIDEALGRALTDSELAEESMGGMFGGSGTTANTFVYLVWAVTQRPQVTRRLKEELHAAFPDGQNIPSGQECAKLPYLQAVINETLRRYPTVIATLPRVVLRDTDIDGIPIPKGTIVGTQNYTIHRDEKAFPDAEAFTPERWLSSEGEVQRKLAFQPFSTGQRSCAGINLAKMELNKLVASFFLRFDVTIDSTITDAEMEMFDQFSASPVGGRLLVTIRDTA